jgi:NhaP-type Na+/H+ or K+/H+ antiporter
VTLFKCHVVAMLVMPKDSRTPSFRQVIVHTAMGAVLGALLALAVLVTNRHFFELIAHSSSPRFHIVLLMGFSSFLIAAGATLSGLIFTTIEINSPLAKQRATSSPDKRRDSGK